MWIASLFIFMLSTPANFEDTFTGQTLRFDYYHSGTAGQEHISLDQVRLEGEWPGSRTQLLDNTNLGKFLFEVIDYATNRVIYSRGFASIYGEWETTAEANAGAWNSIHESQRFPEPRAKCQLVIKKRGRDGAFNQIFATVVDPQSRFVDRSAIAPQGVVKTIQDNGHASKKVDLLILGDGYTADQIAEFQEDASKLSDELFAVEPFKSRRSDFNVHTIIVPSAAEGISNPRKGFWNKTPFGLSFNSFDSDRYVLTYANKYIREVAAQVPYDALIIFGNSRKYGGGGIFNLYMTSSTKSNQAPYLIVHEFGHSFAGLADEYYTSSTSYEDFNPPGVEPWEKNITALLDPSNIKWKHLVDKDTPLPTEWNQTVYDKVSYDFQKRRAKLRAEQADEKVMEAYFKEVKDTTEPLLRKNRHFGKVGAFEGGGYRAKGIYRPELDCIMFTRNPKSFCKVCSEALQQVIDLYVK